MCIVGRVATTSQLAKPATAGNRSMVPLAALFATKASA
jgi:hypothetical protein